jgi:hypothetical protein
VRAAIVDISRGGLSCRCDWRAAAGTEVPIELPDAGGPVIVRIVRSEGGVLALAFRQEEVMLRRVDRYSPSFPRELPRQLDHCANDPCCAALIQAMPPDSAFRP